MKWHLFRFASELDPRLHAMEVLIMVLHPALLREGDRREKTGR